MRFRRTATPKKYLTQGEVESRLYGAPLPDLHKNTRPLSGGALEAKEIINKQIQGANIANINNLEEQAISLVGVDIYNKHKHY
jgi:UDP-galactopyranose mutase